MNLVPVFLQNVMDEVCNYECRPIYEIILMQDNTVDVENLLSLDRVGFYYKFMEAIEDLHYNNLNMREYTYNYAFLVARFPGLYNSVGPSLRLFFRWDDEKGGYFECEEPECFKQIGI